MKNLFKQNFHKNDGIQKNNILGGKVSNQKNVKNRVNNSEKNIHVENLDFNNLSFRKQVEEIDKLVSNLKELIQVKDYRDSEVEELRLKIREKYNTCICNNLNKSHKNGLLNKLWKDVYYSSFISNYRKYLRKGVKKNTNTENRKNSSVKIKKEFDSKLNTFISEYNNFFSEIERKLVKVKKNDKRLTLLIRNILSRMEISIGDLYRYRYLLADKRNADLSMAEKCYQSAVEFNPKSGMGHNQLAVLAHHNKNDIESTYRYYRAVFLEKPFDGARNNLHLVFSKNKKRFENLKDIKDVKLRIRFESLFLKINSILYTKKELSNFQTLLTQIEEIYKSFLPEQTSEYLLKLMFICIGTLEFSLNNFHFLPLLIKYSVELSLSLFGYLVNNFIENKNNKFLSSMNLFIKYLSKSKFYLEEKFQDHININPFFKKFSLLLNQSKNCFLKVNVNFSTIYEDHILYGIFFSYSGVKLIDSDKRGQQLIEQGSNNVRFSLFHFQYSKIFIEENFIFYDGENYSDIKFNKDDNEEEEEETITGIFKVMNNDSDIVSETSTTTAQPQLQQQQQNPFLGSVFFNNSNNMDYQKEDTDEILLFKKENLSDDDDEEDEDTNWGINKDVF